MSRKSVFNMVPNRRQHLMSWRSIVATGTLLLAGLAPNAFGQAFPSRTITVINPYPPGGFADNVTRAVATEAGKILGQSMVVENRPGASGKIGLDAILNAPKDGYTLGIAVPASLALFPVLDPKYAKLHEQYQPITMAVRTYTALAINPAAVPARNMKDFIAWAKANDGKVSYGSAGVGTSYHLWAEAFSLAAGIVPVHVPYKGEAPATSDLLGGQIQFALVTGVAQSNVASGKLLLLATSGAERWNIFPNVPTFRELGMPEVENSGWLGFIGPGPMSRDVVEKLNGALVQALRGPSVEKVLGTQGYVIVGSKPEELAAAARRDGEALGRVIRERNLKLD